MIGYFVEVPQAAGEDLLKAPFNETFVHRQTMAGAMRFSTVELGELEASIASAADRALSIELGIFDALAARVARRRPDRGGGGSARGPRRRPRRSPSSPSSLAWTRPQVDDTLAFASRAGATRSSRRP